MSTEPGEHQAPDGEGADGEPAGDLGVRGGRDEAEDLAFTRGELDNLGWGAQLSTQESGDLRKLGVAADQRLARAPMAF